MVNFFFLKYKFTFYKSFLITQAYYRFNDDKYQWIAKSNWSYITDFHFKSLKLFEEKETWLVFKGLDTFSSIYFNGLKVGESENMFVEYVSFFLLYECFKLE